MENKNINTWKVITIVLSVCAILLIGNLFLIEKQKKDIVSFGSFEIDQYSLNQFKNVMEVGQNARVCNLEKEQCMLLTKIG